MIINQQPPSSGGGGGGTQYRCYSDVTFGGIYDFATNTWVKECMAIEGTHMLVKWPDANPSTYEDMTMICETGTKPLQKTQYFAFIMPAHDVNLYEM